MELPVSTLLHPNPFQKILVVWDWGYILGGSWDVFTMPISVLRASALASVEAQGKQPTCIRF